MTDGDPRETPESTSAEAAEDDAAAEPEAAAPAASDASETQSEPADGDTAATATAATANADTDTAAIDTAATDSPPRPVRNGLKRALAALEWVVVVACSAAFALSFGFNYGVDNQVVYNLGAVHLLNRDLYKHDWFVAHTTSYHPVFEYFSALLLWLNRDGWAFAITTMLLITVMGVLMYCLCRVLTRRLAFAAFLLLLALSFVVRLRSVGVSYIVDYILQPSTLGSVGFVAAMVAFIGKRWTLSGVMLAIGGLFHANYLVLGGLVFGLAQLTLGREKLVSRGIKQLLLPTIALLIFVPTIVKTAGGGDVKAARDILFHLRSPHHFSPSGYEQNFIPFIGWQLLGIGAGLGTILRGKDTPGRRLASLLAAMMLVIWTGTVGATYFKSSFAAQLFVQRIAPHLDLLLQAMWAVAAVELVVAPRRIKHYSMVALGLVAAGLGTLLMFAGNHRIEKMPDLLLLSVAAVAISQAFFWAGQLKFVAAKVSSETAKRWATHAAHALIVLLAFRAVWDSAREGYAQLKQRSTLIKGLNPNEVALYAWLREHTDKDAVILTPPRVEGMRLHSQRAIIVDWKAVPIVPSEILEWRRRLNDVSGRTVRGFRDLGGYDSMDQRRLDQLNRKYHLAYVVTFRGRERRLKARVVYRNAQFTVLKL